LKKIRFRRAKFSGGGIDFFDNAFMNKGDRSDTSRAKPISWVTQIIRQFPLAPAVAWHSSTSPTNSGSSGRGCFVKQHVSRFHRQARARMASGCWLAARKALGYAFTYAQIPTCSNCLTAIFRALLGFRHSLTIFRAQDATSPRPSMWETVPLLRTPAHLLGAGGLFVLLACNIGCHSTFNGALLDRFKSIGCN